MSRSRAYPQRPAVRLAAAALAAPGLSWDERRRLLEDAAAFARRIDVREGLATTKPFPPGPCWLFRSQSRLFVYGTFVRPSSGARVTAHLWAYELFRGPVPRAHRVDHLCEQKRCVSPDHLESVTNAVNVKRSIDRKKARET